MWQEEILVPTHAATERTILRFVRVTSFCALPLQDALRLLPGTFATNLAVNVALSNTWMRLTQPMLPATPPSKLERGNFLGSCQTLLA